MNGLHDVHTVSLERFLDLYKIKASEDGSFEGLAEKEALLRRKRRPNITPSKGDHSLLVEIGWTFLEPINVLLVAVCIALAAIYLSSREEKEHLTVGLFTAIIMLINITVEVYNERILHRISKQSVPLHFCRVRRDGRCTAVQREHLVLGDVLVVGRGDTVGADCRIVWAEDLIVESSLAGGRRGACAKQLGPGSSTGGYEQAENMLLQSDLITAGSAVAVVVEVGEHTVLGKILKKNIALRHGKSVLTHDLNIFFATSFLLATAMNIGLLIPGIFLSITPIQIAAVIVSVYISFLPEGIPSLVKLLLYRAAKKLKMRDVLVREKESIETLGSISVLCADRSALTMGSTLVCEIIADGREMRDVELIFEEKNQQDLEYIKGIGKICTLLSAAAEENAEAPEENGKQSAADAIELLGNICREYFRMNDISDQNNGQNNTAENTPSQPKDTAQSREHRAGGEQAPKTGPSDRRNPVTARSGGLRAAIADMEKYSIVYVIGEPEELLPRCRTWLADAVPERLSRARREKLRAQCEALRSHGYRAMGLAQVATARGAAEWQEKSLTFVAFLGLRYVLKIDAALTISLLQAAGIVVGILGNEPESSMLWMNEELLETNAAKEDSDDCLREGNRLDLRQSIAEQSPSRNSMRQDARLGSQAGRRGGLVPTKIMDAADHGTGEALENLIQERSKQFIIYNADGGQKARIVEDLQRRGHVVAFFGTSGDDCQAMAAADVAICARDAPRACQETSSIILDPQRIEGIIYGIEEGRLFYINLQKAIRYVIMHITPEAITLVIFVFFGTPAPISAILLIFLDYLVEVFPAIFLANESPEMNLITRAPKSAESYAESYIVDLGSAPGCTGMLHRYMRRLERIVGKSGLYSSEILCGSILEVGIITSVSCLIAFYIALSRCGIPSSHFFFVSHEYFRYSSPPLVLENGVVLDSEHQLYILYRAQCTYFIGLMICQFCNLLICRRRKGYAFTDAFNNPKPLLCSLFGIGISVCVIYLQFFEDFLLVRKPVTIALLAPACAGMMILALDSAKKFKQRVAE